ncbi:Elongation factor Ts, mitochondrial [Perkinsus chesapeaki]|uniref:Elongation factor Ts, mitochondrial n=1 Tax=Perkinsus chesapeaki TaxID=330153 RepID=A0A7J6MQ16_PERCH|nr:Elongation factor Ts, mitochondrial [Perkinsus chesapeaki]
MLTRALGSPKPPLVGVSSVRSLLHPHHHCCCCPVCSGRGFSTGAKQAYKPPLALVQELRKRTGASISKCRDALVDEVGDVDKAMLWLKKRGIQSASEKTYREAGEGVVAAAVRGRTGALIEMSCETDFVGRTPLLIEFARTVAGLVAESSKPSYRDLEGFIAEGMLERQVECDVPASEERPKQHQELQSLKISEALLEMSSVLGENVGIKRIATIGEEGGRHQSGHLFSYVHSLANAGQSREVGKMGSLIMLDKAVAGDDEVDAESIGFLGKVLAMQVVAKRPKYVTVEDIPTGKGKLGREDGGIVELIDVLESERQIARAAHVASIGGKELADKVMDKIVDGKMGKLRADDTLYEMEILLPPSAEENSGKVETVGERLRKSGLVVRDFRFMGVGLH